MKKGIVMEITDDYVTMLTPEGEFLRSRREQRRYELGEEVLFFPLTADKLHFSETKIKRRSWRKVVAGTMAAAALLLFFIPYYMQQQVYAYMSIDINPSLELGVNRDFEVVEVNTFNEDAKKLMANIKDWEHHPVEEVASIILKSSEQQGYLKREKEVLITTVLQKKKKDYEEQLQLNVQAVAKQWESEQYEIKTVNSSFKMREAAAEAGVSTGTWLREKEEKKKPVPKLDRDEKERLKQETTPISPAKEELPSSQVEKEKKAIDRKEESPKATKQQAEQKAEKEVPKSEEKPKSSVSQPSQQEKKANKDDEKEKEIKLPPGQEKKINKGNKDEDDDAEDEDENESKSSGDDKEKDKQKEKNKDKEDD